MKILIYGFGRMGLTHFTILNGLDSSHDFSVIEPNKFLRKILNNNINAKFYSDDTTLNEPFDITLITTPPFIHLKLLKKSLERGDKKIFIEKPFGGYTNINFDQVFESKKIFIGYVLRFNPCVQWIKSNINTQEIESIHGQYLSNTIEKKPSGWRNGPFSGVLNEMGSHIIDLLQYISGSTQMKVISSKKESIVSDMDDIVDATLKTENDVSVSIYLNWVKKEIRKPIFGIDIVMKDGSKYFIDQQQIKQYNSDGEFIGIISVTNLAESVPFYLRGTDFTNQMIDLLNQGEILANVNDALSVNRLMEKILNHENNIGR